VRVGVQRLLLIAGLLALGFASYSYAARYVYQAYESWRFDHSVGRPGVSDNSTIGRIDIPRLGISTMVKEGVGDETLDLAAGHISSTAMPGQPGNVGIAAHRDNLFRNLRHVKRGDEITLKTADREYVYRVVYLRLVNPTQ
jgi:sortase A